MPNPNTQKPRGSPFALKRRRENNPHGGGRGEYFLSKETTTIKNGIVFRITRKEQESQGMPVRGRRNKKDRLNERS